MITIRVHQNWRRRIHLRKYFQSVRMGEKRQNSRPYVNAQSIYNQTDELMTQIEIKGDENTFADDQG